MKVIRRTALWSMSAMLLAACSAKQSTAEGTLSLPVSEKQLCLDWYTVFDGFMSDEEEEVLAAPNRYIVTDLDHDGLAEVLMQGANSNHAAILSYDKEGQVKFSDFTTDGYLCLGAGDGWYVREFDDHMGEYRTWTRYYYKVENGEFNFIGEKAFGFDGLDANGDYIEKEEDGTGGQAPDNDQIRLFDLMEGWTTISDDAKADALATLADGESTVDDGCDIPDNQYFAAEVALDNGSRLRLDYMIDANDHVSGFTTYYRSNGKTSKIPFFGTKFYDRFVNQDFVMVNEYYNGKCCGHMTWSLSEANELNSGSWYLRDKELRFDTYEVTSPDTEVDCSASSLNLSLADQLLPCNRQTLKELFAKAYPETGAANYFMIVDMDNDGVFEVFVQNDAGSVAKTALVWMDNGEPKVMGFGERHRVSLHVAGMLVQSAEGNAFYRWNNGAPVKDDKMDSEELQFFADYSQDMNAMGEWLSM